MSTHGQHQTVVELLPWFVNGTLSGDEHKLVERHVHECVQCYAILQQERRLNALIGNRSAAKLSSAEHGLERLWPSIGGSAARSMLRPFGRVRRLLPRATALAAAAGFAAIGLVAALWLGSDRPPDPSGAAFETLTESAAASPARLDVIFVADLPEEELHGLLRANGATIVRGPTGIGRYTIELQGPPTDAELAEVIARLGSDARVHFVGRSYIGEADQ